MDWVKLVLVTVLATVGALALEAFVTRGLSSSGGEAPPMSLRTGAEQPPAETRERRRDEE